jgi:hypothetical protein
MYIILVLINIFASLYLSTKKEILLLSQKKEEGSKGIGPLCGLNTLGFLY